MTRKERCAKMRAAKAARRVSLGETPQAREIGRAEFSGPAFGRHTVRLIALSGRQAVDVEVDGRHTCCKTQRGARALLMRRIAGAVSGSAPEAGYPEHVAGYGSGVTA